MKKASKSHPDEVAAKAKDFLADHPRALLELLPDEMFPDGDRDAVSITIERVDLMQSNRETPSHPYERNDPLQVFIREQPEVFLELLRERGLRLPAYSKVKIEEHDLDHVEPQAPTHTVLVCQQRGKPVYAIAVDILRRVIEDKTRRFPLNAVLLHLRLDTRTSLVVIAGSPEVEAWASQPIYWQGEENPPFRSVVIGPSLFARFDAASVARDPARAAFGALLGSLKASS